MFTGYLARAFDLIDVRDLDLIQQAARKCASLVVGVYTDDDYERRFGRRPILPEHERAAIVEQVRGVDRVVSHVPGSPFDVDVVFTAPADDAERPSGPAELVELRPARRSESGLLSRLDEQPDRQRSAAVA